jgi:hypothetical protein
MVVFWRQDSNILQKRKSAFTKGKDHASQTKYSPVCFQYVLIVIKRLRLRNTNPTTGTNLCANLACSFNKHAGTGRSR